MQELFPDGSLILGSSQFRPLPQLPQKILLNLEVVKIDLKIIIALCQCKFATHSVGLTQKSNHQFSAAVFSIVEARFPELSEGPRGSTRAGCQQIENVGRNPSFDRLLLLLLLRRQLLSHSIASSNINVCDLNEIATCNSDFVVANWIQRGNQFYVQNSIFVLIKKNFFNTREKELLLHLTPRRWSLVRG